MRRILLALSSRMPYSQYMNQTSPEANDHSGQKENKSNPYSRRTLLKKMGAVFAGFGLGVAAKPAVEAAQAFGKVIENAQPLTLEKAKERLPKLRQDFEAALDDLILGKSTKVSRLVSVSQEYLRHYLVAFPELPENTKDLPHLNFQVFLDYGSTQLNASTKVNDANGALFEDSSREENNTSVSLRTKDLPDLGGFIAQNPGQLGGFTIGEQLGRKVLLGENGRPQVEYTGVEVTNPVLKKKIVGLLQMAAEGTVWPDDLEKTSIRLEDKVYIASNKEVTLIGGQVTLEVSVNCWVEKFSPKTKQRYTVSANLGQTLALPYQQNQAEITASQGIKNPATMSISLGVKPLPDGENKQILQVQTDLRNPQVDHHAQLALELLTTESAVTSSKP